MQYRGTEMLSVTNDNGMIRVFEANSGEEIMDIPRYLLSVQVGPFVEFKAAAHCTAQYAVDLPIGKNSHIGSAWYHPRLTRDEAALLLRLEESGTFVCDTVVSYHQVSVLKHGSMLDCTRHTGRTRALLRVSRGGV